MNRREFGLRLSPRRSGARGEPRGATRRGRQLGAGVAKATSAQRRAAVWLAGFVVLAVGCQAPLSVEPPRDFDLNGTWVLDARSSDAAPDAQAIRRLEDRDVARGRQRNAAASSAFVAEDFPVLNTKAMTIEQDARSMGIEYDNGAYRDVSWGERERDYWTVQAGWRDGVLVIQSRRDLIEGVETMRLERAGRLHVEVAVKTGGRDVRAKRVFERRDGRLPHRQPSS